MIFQYFVEVTMKKYFVLAVISLGILLSACGGKVQEMKEVAEAIQKAPEAAQKMEQANNEGQKRYEQRRAKGDTLAIHFNELMKYLPQNVDGYKAEEPTGSTTNSMGFSLSQVERKFTKPGTDGNESYIHLTIVDYNAGYAFYAGLTYWAAMDIQQETTEGYQKTFKPGIEYSVAYEEYTKSNKTAKVTYSLGYRFLLTMEANNQSNTDLLKDIAKRMDLKKLASL
jgi:hypothetical protein